MFGKNSQIMTFFLRASLVSLWTSESEVPRLHVQSQSFVAYLHCIATTKNWHFCPREKSIFPSEAISTARHSRNNLCFSQLHNLTHSAGAKVPNLGQTGQKRTRREQGKGKNVRRQGGGRAPFMRSLLEVLSRPGRNLGKLMRNMMGFFQRY